MTTPKIFQKVEHEREDILREAHEANLGGYNPIDGIDRKVLLTSLWWPNLFKYAKKYARKCDTWYWDKKALKAQ